MLQFTWQALPALWPGAAAVILLTVVLAVRPSSARFTWLSALAAWAASIGVYELGVGQESSVPFHAAPGYYVTAWLFATAVPILAVALTFRLLRGRSVVARAGLSAVIGLVAVLPMPALMLAISCLAGVCL